MPMYRCDWPNGDVTFVLARDIEDAILQLDELGDAEPRMLKRIHEFMIDLKPNRRALLANERARKEGRDETENPWELGEFGEVMLDPESDLLPSEESTLRRLRKYEKEGKLSQREQELRRRAEQEGKIIDLTMRRLARTSRRPAPLE